MSDLFLQSGAEFSPCRVWRYLLWRIWDDSLPKLNVIGLNPSTADETKDDPTIRRCQGFARDWGYGGLYMANIFAFRATLPKDMKAAPDPIGPDNDQWIIEGAARSKLVIAAWGTHGVYLNRGQAVCKLFAPGELYCFRLTPKTGAPEHPLYLPKGIQPIIFTAPMNATR